MKRLLLFSIVLATTGSLLAQNSSRTVSQMTVLHNTSIFSPDPAPGTPFKKSNAIFHHSSSVINTRSAGVNFIPFASSFNLYTLVVSEENCLTANQDLNLISFTHRACNSYATGIGNSGWVNSSFSTDGGNTWDTTLLVMTVGGKATDSACRYPSGAIYNPAGNTDPKKAFSVVVGPYTDNANWVGYYFGSESYNHTSNNQQIYSIDSPKTAFQYMPRVGMTFAGNHAFVIGDNQYVAASSSTTTGPFNGLVLNRGTFNASDSAFTWTSQVIHTPVAANPLGGQYYGQTDMAWAAGGDTGYIIQYGVDSVQFANSGYAGFYPIVYKSVDSGVTWNKLPYFSFDTLSYLQLVMRNSSSHPFIDGSNGTKSVVDYKGNLHIITDIESGSSNVDSLNYSYLIPAYIFDLSTSDGTTWKDIYIDTIGTLAAASQVWTSSSGAPIVDGRIQASITSDRKKVFATWLESDVNVDGDNDFPDIYSRGIDYTNGFVTPPVNFTAGTNFTGQCYWLYASTIALSNSGTYSIPATVSLNSTYDADVAIEHYSVTGIQFVDTDFHDETGIRTIANGNLGLGIYPNPSNGNVTVSFTKYTGTASIIITNLLGSTVKQLNNVNVGSNNLSLNLSDLVSGIYFVRVETSQGAETQKIVIANKN